MASEQLARLIVEQAAEAVVVCDETGRIMRFSNAVFRILGSDPSDQIFQDLFDLRLPSGKKLSPVSAALQGDVLLQVEASFERSEGIRFHLLLNSGPLRSKDGKIIGCVVTLTDITARKRSEERIAQQNVILKAINHVYEEAIRCETPEDLGRACLDIIDSITDSKFSFVGEIGPDGLHHEVAISDHGWGLCAMNDKTGHRRPPGNFKIHGLYGRVLQDGKSILTNSPAEHPDSIGTPSGHLPLTAFLGVPFIRDGKAVGMIGVANREGGYRTVDQEILEALTPTVLEVLQRKRAEIALLESEQRWATTLASIGDAVIATDLTGRLTFMNAVAENLTGWTLKEASMKPVTEVFSIINEHTRQRVKDPVAKVIENGMIVGLANHTVLVRKDGTEVPIDDSGAPIMDKNGKTTGVVLVFRDITERKQAMKEVESLAKFPSENPSPVVRASIDGTIIYANRNSAPLLDMWGARVGQKLPEDYRNLMQESIGSGVGKEIEATFNGTTYSMVIAPVADMGYANIYGRDITERKRAEEALERSSHEVIEILESIKDGFFSLDRDWRFIYVNRRAAGNLSLKPEDLSGQIIWEKFPRIAGTPHEAAYRRAMVEREIQRFEIRGVLTDQWYDITVYPSIQGISVYWRDISERKSAEEALRAGEERYRSLFSSMTEGFALHEIVYDADGQPCDYRFLEINPAFERLTSLKRDDVIGHMHNQIMPDDDPKWLQEYGKVAMTGNPVHFENYSPALNRYYEVHAYRPAPQQFAVVFMDITERKLAEECLRASLAEKEVLLKEIHHRVKNNMQVISSLISLQANSPADPAVKRVLEDLRGRVHTMALVHEKLSLSHDISRVDFAEYARSLLHSIWRANASDSAKVRLKLDLQPMQLPVEAAVPCGLILNELATNSLKHAFRGKDEGAVTVALRKSADGQTCLTVSDDGIGLPADLDWRQSPTLGLQLVSMLARQLGGTMEVHKGDGAEFRIVFGSQEGPKGGKAGGHEDRS